MAPDSALAEPKLSPFYIPSSAAVGLEQSHVLKHTDGFVVVDKFGDMQATGTGPEGLFFNDTRHLAQCRLTINGVRPLLLSSSVTTDNAMISVDLANPDLGRDGQIEIARNTVHIMRSIGLGDDGLKEVIELRKI